MFFCAPSRRMKSSSTCGLKRCQVLMYPAWSNSQWNHLFDRKNIPTGMMGGSDFHRKKTLAVGSYTPRKWRCELVKHQISEGIPPGKLTWNLKITHLKRKIIFQSWVCSGAVGDLQRVVPLSHAVGRLKTVRYPTRQIKSGWISLNKLDGWGWNNWVCCEVVGF